MNVGTFEHVEIDLLELGERVMQIFDEIYWIGPNQWYYDWLFMLEEA